MGDTVAIEVYTQEIVFSVIYCIGMIAAFFIGVKQLCAKKSPLYFRLIVYAVGCSALEAICTLVVILCSSSNDPSRIGRLVSTLACYLFLASANWGQIDGLVDEKTPATRRASIISAAFPVAAAVVVPFVWNGILKKDEAALGVFLLLETVPLAIGGYFSLKHLLLPMDELGIKKMTGKINVTILITIILGLLYIISLGFLLKGQPLFSDIVRAALLVNTFFMIRAAIKGNKIWKTLV